MLKNRVVYCLVILGLFLFYLYCNSYVPFAAILLLIGFTVIGGAEAFAASRKLFVTVAASPAQPDKRLVEFCAKAECKTFLPAPVVNFELRFKDASEDEFIRRRIRVSVGAYESKEVYVSMAAKYAALVECTALKARVCDPFGIFSFPAKGRSASANSLITPSYAGSAKGCRICTDELADSDRYSDTQKGEDRSQVFEVREYRDGDDIRNVHWRLSSKLDLLMVKEFSRPIEESCTVLLESSLAAGVSPEEIKKRADRLLGEFLSLASFLLESEQPFEVTFYSARAGRLISFGVSQYGELAPALKAFLSEKLPAEPMYTFNMYLSDAPGGSAYYIFDSSVPGSEPTDGLKNIVVIDSSEKSAEKR